MGTFEYIDIPDRKRLDSNAHVDRIVLRVVPVKKGLNLAELRPLIYEKRHPLSLHRFQSIK